MSKILIVGDLHFGTNENDDNFINYQFEAIKWMYNIASDNDIKDIVFLGDIFNHRRVVNFKTLSRVYGEFCNKEFNHHLLVGNHDAFFKNNNELNSLQLLFQDIPNVTVYFDVPTEIELFETKVLMTPWINKENYDEAVSNVSMSKAKYLFGHLDLAGFELLRGFISEKNSIPRILLDRFEQVISGHYHCHSSTGNILFLGSLCQLNWGDVDEKKYVGILDVKTEELDLINNPNIFYIKHKIKKDEDCLEEIEKFRNKAVKLYLYVERNIKIEKFITSVIEVAADVKVIDEKVMSNSGDIKLDSAKLSIIDLWNKYLQELELPDSDKKVINNIFNTTYHHVISGNTDDEFSED